MKKKFKKILRKQEAPKEKSPENHEGPLPRITNDTVASHREEVLSSARKYIYPLQHSKHKIVIISTALFAALLIGFFATTTLALYKFKSTSEFLLGVTKVVPFPIAKVGSNYVAYENYLFEIKHYKHYYETQQKLDFNSDQGKQQLDDYKKRALNKVIDEAIVKQLAAQHHVSVTDKELDEQIALMRRQSRLGASDKAFEDVLRDNFGWSISDFRRSLKQQMLAQKLVSVLDTDAQAKAVAALNELSHGKSFAAVAKKYSEETATKNNGGDFGYLVAQSNRDLPPQTIETLFELKPGETSGIINTGYTLEILKNTKKEGDRVRAAHIVINLKDISTYLNDAKEQTKAQTYIKL